MLSFCSGISISECPALRGATRSISAVFIAPSFFLYWSPFFLVSLSHFPNICLHICCALIISASKFHGLLEKKGASTQPQGSVWILRSGFLYHCMPFSAHIMALPPTSHLARERQNVLGCFARSGSPPWSHLLIHSFINLLDSYWTLKMCQPLS